MNRYYCGDCGVAYVHKGEQDQVSPCVCMGKKIKFVESIFPANVEVINMIAMLTTQLSEANRAHQNSENQKMALNGSLAQTSKALVEAKEEILQLIDKGDTMFKELLELRADKVKKAQS